MTETAIQELLTHRPELKKAETKLRSMQPGSFCLHRSWGFGQILEYDEVDRKLVINFDAKTGHRMDPAFCVDTLDILPADHLLVRQKTEPDVIRQLVEKNPVELVIQLLQQYPEKSASSNDLESTLSQLLGASRFKKWWTGVKRQLVKDPRVAAPTRKSDPYILREEPVSMEDELTEEFFTTRSARRKITLAEKLLEAVKSSQGGGTDVSSILQEMVRVIDASGHLETHERMVGAWIRDRLAMEAGHDPSTLEPKLSSFVEDPKQLPELADKLPVAWQNDLLELVKESHPAQWKEILFSLLKSSSGKFTTDCINFLLDKGLEQELAATLHRWQAEQNLRAPVLLWIIRNRQSRKFGKLLQPMIGPRLMSAILFATDYEALQTAGTRRIALADEISDDQDLIPDLLAAADSETARDLANTLLLNQGFEELTKKSIIARFIKLFPSVQSLLATEATEKDERFLVSRESYDKRRREYEELVSKKIPANSRAIAEAREHGDLRENSEFKMAKQDQAVLLAQKAQLEMELARAQITDFSEAAASQVGVGCIVDLVDEATGQETTYTILGAWDGNPEQHVISYQTPLGSSLLGAVPGAVVTVIIDNHQFAMRVKNIRRYVDTFNA